METGPIAPQMPATVWAKAKSQDDNPEVAGPNCLGHHVYFPGFAPAENWNQVLEPGVPLPVRHILFYHVFIVYSKKITFF